MTACMLNDVFKMAGLEAEIGDTDAGELWGPVFAGEWQWTSATLFGPLPEKSVIEGVGELIFFEDIEGNIAAVMRYYE